ncbi:MAG TPA: Sec-independent protein translocase protein TatB [Rhodopila sp.]|uniref:Sec-independent protein translocase protein TatB n=1 Tax=Rhodopila sp. TaxID=2480087 RepID=UPI002BFF1202|nr:Sec-independent protein translocase protein TatB [Rhodopila sp.]HVY17592.1 Sec-independent protein translocase protein TatB [Rhodopila sp.]
MFDFAWSEIMLIGAVALIAIGPKDMPAAIRTVTTMIKKARRMAAEFQTHVDDLVREAELGDVKSAFSDLRRMDIASALEKAVDPDRSIRRTFEENPFDQPSAAPGAAPGATPEATEVSTLDPVTIDAPAQEPVDPEAAGDGEPADAEAPQGQDEAQGPAAPAFIPPQLVPKPKAQASQPEAPAFIPPEAVLQRQPPA